MSLLHFQPISGKSLDIINAILQTEEVTSVGEVYGVIRLVTEELVLNIVNYAYPNDDNGYLDVEIIRDETSITLRFHDGGVPFNPLEKEPPDITLPLYERKIGGLGILMVIREMDSTEYEYTEGENVMTVSKTLNKEQ